MSKGTSCRWISLDCATVGGACTWYGQHWLVPLLIKPNKAQDQWTVTGYAKGREPVVIGVYATEKEAWRDIKSPASVIGQSPQLWKLERDRHYDIVAADDSISPGARVDAIAHRMQQGTYGLVIERGHGANPKAIDSLARRRGYVHGLLEAWGVDQVFELHSGTWGKVVAKHFGMKAWPKTSIARKTEAVARLASSAFGLDVPPDTAEGTLIGLAATKLDIMPPR